MPNETDHGELAGQVFKIKNTGKDFQLTNQRNGMPVDGGGDTVSVPVMQLTK